MGSSIRPTLAAPPPVTSAAPARLEPVTLAYESADGGEPTGPRPKWVYAVVGLYVLLLAALVGASVVLPVLAGEGVWPPLVITVTALLVCEFALLFVPVRIAGRRRVPRRALWAPILASGALAGLLLFGAAIALGEWADDDFFNGPLWLALAGAAALWFAWTVIFWVLTGKSNDPTSLAARLHRYLLAGSVLELLVAVPTHLVVRRRTECCAGIATGTAIGIGTVVMLLAFGPSVALLYYKRWKQVSPPAREPSMQAQILTGNPDG